MIKILRKKFIITTMAAVTILLLLMLGTLNVLNYVSLNTYADKLLLSIVAAYNNDPAVWENYDEVNNTYPVTVRDKSDIIRPDEGDSAESSDNSSGDVETPDNILESDPEPEDIDIENRTPFAVHFGFITPQISMNDLMSAVYYTVTINQDNDIIYTDISRIANVSEEEANETALNLFLSGRTIGWYGNSKFISSLDKDGNNVIVILERTPDLINLRRLLLFSAIIFMVCFGITLLIVILVSGKMLNPIVNNIDRQKAFITNAGHEIKTPLAIIQANTEAMETCLGENKWTVNIKGQTKRLSILMNNMLTLARAQDSTELMVIEKIDLSGLLRDFSKMFYEPAAGKGLIIRENIDDSLVIQGNRIQAAQLISILLDNAVKYAVEKTEIFVDAHRADKVTVVEISNYCDPLPECEPERLFERFYRPDSSRYGKESGNGIGLSAAKAIIESFGGSVSCKYEMKDMIVFTLTFTK